MKKTLFLAVFAFSAAVYANAPATPEQEQALQAQYNLYLKSQGITLPNQGVQVVPAKTIAVPEAIKQKAEKNTRESIKNGYVENRNPRIVELRDINHTAPYEKQKYLNDLNPMSTHLRDTPAEIRMAYNFRTVPNEDANNIIGFAPVGTYVEDGWTGMVEIFTKRNLGNCNYEENNLKLMHATIRIPDNIVTHDINNKVTTMNVQGNAQDGFLYTISWYDEEFSRKLECVTEKYSQNTLAFITDIARRIDS